MALPANFQSNCRIPPFSNNIPWFWSSATSSSGPAMLWSRWNPSRFPNIPNRSHVVQQTAHNITQHTTLSRIVELQWKYLVIIPDIHRLAFASLVNVIVITRIFKLCDYDELFVRRMCRAMFAGLCLRCLCCCSSICFYSPTPNHPRLGHGGGGGP